jgi:site-specific recombinase XerD
VHLDVTRREPAAPTPLVPRGADQLAAAFLLGYGASTRAAYRSGLKSWAGFLSSMGVEPLHAHRAHVDFYVRAMDEEGLAAATIARRLATLSGFYAYAVDEELIARSPVARVRRPRAPQDSPRLGLDRPQLAALLAAAAASGPRDHALVCLLALNGLRVSEVVGAQIADLGTERGHRTLRVRRKGGRKQVAALAPRTATAVNALLSERTEGPIFVTRSGLALDRQAAAKSVRRLARVAGVPSRVSPHSLRHTFVTTALDAGVPLRDVQDAAGHADPRTTRRYDRARYSLDRHATYAVAAAVS